LGSTVDIRRDLRVVAEEHGFRRHQRHAVRQGLGARAALERGFHQRQFGAAVHAQRILRPAFDGGAGAAQLARGGDQVRQVELALGIVVLEQRCPVEEFLRIGGITAGIAQRHAAFGVRRVFILDDAAQESVRRQQHAAILGGVVRLKGQQRQAGARLGGETFGHHLRCDQRHVAIDDQKRAGKIGQHRTGAGGGMAGAQLLMLDGAFAAQGLGVIAHRLTGGRGHHHDALDARTAQRRHDMAQQRQSRHLVQHLGQRGFHPRSGTRSQYHGSPSHDDRVVPAEKKMK
jgi:hypothetical protein